MKITVIDSGLGGIAFSKSIKVDINHLDVSLLIDKDGFPYGDKNLEWLRERLNFLVNSSKSNVVIIACNTLSSLIFFYDMNFNKTVVDVITPTIYFLQRTNKKNICIIATKNTIKMDIYSKLLICNIKYLDASDLISDLEYKNNYIDSLNALVNNVDSGIDAVILGCTHLIEIKEEFRKRLDTEIVSQDEIFISLFKNDFTKK